MPAFDPQSRYANLDNASLMATGSDGEPRRLCYKRRRFLPSLSSQTTLTQHCLRESERLDLLANEYLDDPQKFWQICDANPILHPDELEEELGQLVRIATAAFDGSSPT